MNDPQGTLTEETPADAPARRAVPTIYDVAREAGVNASTVSRALNKPGRINRVTEQRVRAVALELGYRTNPMARALPTGRTDTLAILISDITNPVYFDLVRGAERAIAATGQTLVYAESQESGEVELATAGRLQSAVDGILLVASRLRDDEIGRLAATKPVVLANRAVPGLPCITPDVTAGVAQAISHLADLGHRSIGYLAGPAGSWMNRTRWEAIFRSARAHGLSIAMFTAGRPTVEGGEQALPKIIASGVTAVITYNDLMALGLVRACRMAGVTVPGRLSVVGFDDIFGADLTTPSLTTVRSPLAAVGEASVHRLVAEVRGEHGVDEVSGLATTLIVRESTGPVERI
jgi:LacI family transcriptional regulator